MRSRKNLVECSSVPVLVTEEQARELDSLTKSLPADCTFQRKAYDASSVFEEGERAEVSIISAETVDKSKEVVLLDGLELDTYNGVVFYNHNKDEIVGNCVWVKLHDKDRTLRAKTEYFENTTGQESRWYKFVDEVWTMVQAGALKAKSIGFQPLEPKSDPTPEELQAHPDWAGAGIWRRAMLLEYSVCPVGINNDALVELVNKGLAPEKLEALGVPCPCVKAEPPAPSREELIAEVLRYGKPIPKRKAPRKPSPGKIIAKALERLDMDKILGAYLSPEAILAQARKAYRDRGKI